MKIVDVMLKVKADSAKEAETYVQQILGDMVATSDTLVDFEVQETFDARDITFGKDLK